MGIIKREINNSTSSMSMTEWNINYQHDANGLKFFLNETIKSLHSSVDCNNFH